MPAGKKSYSLVQSRPTKDEQHSTGSLTKMENPLGKMDGKFTPKNVDTTDSCALETGYSLVKSGKDEQHSTGSLKEIQNPLGYSTPKNVDTTDSCAPEPGSGRRTSENGSHLDNGTTHANGTSPRNGGNTTNGTSPKDNISPENGANVDDVASPFNGKSSANGNSPGNGTPPIKHTIAFANAFEQPPQIVISPPPEDHIESKPSSPGDTDELTSGRPPVKALVKGRLNKSDAKSTTLKDQSCQPKISDTNRSTSSCKVTPADAATQINVKSFDHDDKRPAKERPSGKAEAVISPKSSRETTREQTGKTPKGKPKANNPSVSLPMPPSSSQSVATPPVANQPNAEDMQQGQEPPTQQGKDATNESNSKCPCACFPWC